MSSGRRSRRAVLLVLGVIVVIMIGVAPAKAQSMLTGWMGGGYCYDWGNMVSGKTVRIYSSGGRRVEAQTPYGVMYGEWVGPGDAALDAGNQLICCYGRRRTGQQYGVCLLCD